MDIGVLFEELYKNNIRYLITGGLAVNLYGVNRMTADIDLILDLTQDNIRQFHSTVRELDFIPLLPLPLNSLEDKIERLKLIEEKNLIAYSYYNRSKKYMNVDIIIDVPTAFDELWKNREVRKIDNYELNVLSLNDLINLKEYADRAQDKNDILLLKSANNKK